MRRLLSFEMLSIKPNKILRDQEKYHSSNTIKIILSFLLLVVLYSSFYIIMVFMMADIYSRYNNYIIKVWLLPGLFEALVYSFLNTFFMNLFKSFLLFKFYRFRKASGWKSFLFNLLVDTNILSTYKIRKMIIKYSIELNCVFSEEGS
jgi:hypothetical protein